MVNWSDPQEMRRDTVALLNLNHVFFGLLLWEIFVTLDFEWSLLTRQRRFRWPLGFFFINRYFIVFAIVGIITSYAVTTRINCSALYTFNTFSLNLSILSATTSLMLRTITLWGNKLFMIIPLSTLTLGQGAILLRSAFNVESAWDPMTKACSLSFTQPAFLTVMLFYNMIFLLVFLVTACIAMVRIPSKRSMLSRLFFGEGLFFFIAFAASCIPAIINVVHLNGIMDVIAIVPAAAVLSISAFRVVLLEDSSSGDLTSSVGFSRSRIAFRPRGPHRTGVHVTTEHIITTDEQSKSYSSPETDNGESEYSLSDKQLEAQYTKEIGPSTV